MSAAPALYDWGKERTVEVSADGFTYKVEYRKGQYGHFCMAHLQFHHFKNGKRIKAPTPLTETGFRSEHLNSKTVENYNTLEDALSAFLKVRHDLPKFKKEEAKRREAENAARQFCLF